MRVRFTDAAESDLEAIGNFIANDSPARAVTFVQELVDRSIELGSHPLRYPVYVVRDGREIRRRAHGRYITFYSIVGDVVEINHIVHGARDYARLFSDD